MLRQFDYKAIRGEHMPSELSGSFDLMNTNSKYFDTLVLKDSQPVNSLWDAFDIFKSNWNSVLRTSMQEYKTLILDKNHRSKSLISFLENRRLIDRSYIIEQLMEQVLNQQGEPAIIIAQNHPLKPLNPDESVFKTSEKFYEAAASMNIKLLNHIVLSRDGFYVMPPKNNLSILEPSNL